MKLHTKKLIAPIVITCIISIYLLFFIIQCFIVKGEPLIVKLFGILFPTLILGETIYVLVERIKEIKGGEEDDLSKY